MKKVRPQSIGVTDVKNSGDDSISDHLAVKASLVFTKSSAAVFAELTKTGRYAR